MALRTTLLIFILMFSSLVYSGSDPFTVELEEIPAVNAPTLQSFAYAQSGGKWLLLGGRTNGLHSFNSSPSFPSRFQNRTMYVYDPVTGQVWSRSTYQDLSLALADRLSSTNTNYTQVGNRLYVIGGYGLDSLQDSITTFQNITAIDVNETINAIVNGQSVSPYVRTLEDSRLACTGGDLGYKDGYFYLYGGQRFYGDYLSPFSVQYYNYSYSKFQVVDNGSTLSLANYNVTVDSTNLRRRDLNFVDAVHPDGTPYFINYGAVFTLSTLPWLNPVYLDDTGYTVDESFDQLFQQYDCASFVMMDSTTGDLYTTLFGGISYYYYDTVIQQVVQDSLVPFVHDITYITKGADGTTNQDILPIRMPDLLGAEAKLIADTTVPQYENGVIKFHELTQRTKVGYIFGGIHADTSNFGNKSTASGKIFAVYVTPKSVGIQNISGEVPADYTLSQNYPNPFNPSTKIRFSIPKSNFVKLNIYNALGQKVSQMLNRALDAGTYEVNWHAHDFPSGIYFYTIEADDFTQTRKMVLVK
jgi:hypothetical protein